MKATHVTRVECHVNSVENNFIHSVFHPLRRQLKFVLSVLFFFVFPSFRNQFSDYTAEGSGFCSRQVLRFFSSRSSDRLWGPPSFLSRWPFARGIAAVAWNWCLSSVFCQGRMHDSCTRRHSTALRQCAVLCWYPAFFLKTVFYLELLDCNAV
jgi:hypothetical protein